ncbi:starch phosphorylase [Tistlia consotensis]|uniref:Alpha-1,4 glucan phosphorylase n=1 Tax=Tistlia consotensis USBA 355 TaxID=560819 RepID=A0A1Y6BC14_9PROT|nr:glycogen/starch/alpha-glucan phosphorylase [Tistlia consotensis]SME97035.1 starch phosphorylase [Tistlia consotensis USBA 355]SNR56453.1 starch phosphorylase [Tistlia consotensis]
MTERLPTALGLAQRIEQHLTFSLGKAPATASTRDWRLALSRAVRDAVVVPWLAAEQRTQETGHKRVYYLSMEFLVGRLLQNAVANLGLEEAARAALAGLGADYETVVLDEPDAALGNGGLGRLAICFLDSLASLAIPAYGYGIRYAHGLFRQRFRGGWQVEEPETWLNEGYAWEFERPDASLPIGFGGRIAGRVGDRAAWAPDETVLAAAFDTPVPGWRGRWANTLRLWSARPLRAFDLAAFNRGDFVGAAAPEVLAETISRVLYPDDSTPQGRELRLKQEYFFTAASIRDILRRHLAEHGDLASLPDKVAIQLNDTHPAIAGPELVRLLVDEHRLAFHEAWQTARGCLSYTNHTLLPEALERWPAELLGRVLPRHLEIVERIDAKHRAALAAAGRRAAEELRIVAPSGDLGGEVRMGDLAFVMARRVNGVSALHTALMRRTVFRELEAAHPGRIVNQTNGVTPRRWLHGCNPPLRRLLTEAIGEAWVDDLERLEELVPLVEDAGFRAAFAAAKQANKERLAGYLSARCGVTVDPGALFDVQIKRIHEYKRQLLNILETAALANALRRDPGADWTPRVKIFGGKAAPGYADAKLIIKLINDVAASINGDPALRGRLQVVFPENYNVSMAEVMIPAADLSEQVSTAGMEASGTGNMKLMLNGALTVGTLDGANVEIGERVGPENIYVFGLDAEGAARHLPFHDGAAAIAATPPLAEVVAQIESGFFSPDDPRRYDRLVEKLRRDDRYLVTADFAAYFETQRRIDRDFRTADAWTRRAALNTAKGGWFSSDRTIRGYAREMWQVEPALQTGS